MPTIKSDEWCFVISGELTSLNEYIQAERGNRFAAHNIKEGETRRVFWECKQQKIGRFPVPCVIEIHWYTKNKRKDCDNISFAKKFILDGMVLAGVLPDDTRDVVVGFIDKFFVDSKNERVEIYGMGILEKTDSESSNVQEKDKI